MRAKFLLFTITAILLQAAAAQAQFGLGKPKEIAIVKSQPLIILLKEEDPKQLKKLAGKPEELADYKSGVADYNAQMRELAPKLWKLSSGVEFQPESELETLRKAKKTQRAVLRHLSFMLGHRHHLGGTSMNSTSRGDYYYTSEQVSALVIDLFGGGDENHVGRIQIAAGPVYPSDIIFSLKYLQTYLQARAEGRSRDDFREEIAQNGKRIPHKTLLIDEDDVKNKLTAADIKQVYPYPYQIVARAAIEKAVADADGRYAYIRLLPATETVTVQVVVDADNADLLGMSIPSRVQMLGVSNGSSIGKGNFKDFAKSAGK